MAPQIACATLNYRPTVHIVLNSTPPAIIVVTAVVVVVLTASIISLSSRRGTLRTSVPAPS